MVIFNNDRNRRSPLKIALYDNKLNLVRFIHNFESFIWTERYNESGDFEIVVPMSYDIYSLVQPGYYIWFERSERLMIVEDFDYEQGSDGGLDKYKITGRSLESILDRRVITGDSQITGKLDTVIHNVLNWNIISPSASKRKIDQIIWKDSLDKSGSAKNIDQKVEGGTSVYELFNDLCSDNDIGYKLIGTSDKKINSDHKFYFELYTGLDRSTNQIKNQRIVFSPKYMPISDMQYTESNSDYKNTIFMSSERTVNNHTYKVTTWRYSDNSNEPSGLDRKEVFQSESVIGDENTSDSDVVKQLQWQGDSKLKELANIAGFTCSTDGIGYVYGTDYNLGDIVEVINSYGMDFQARVTEYIFSYSSSGYNEYPTLEPI